MKNITSSIADNAPCAAKRRKTQGDDFKPTQPDAVDDFEEGLQKLKRHKIPSFYENRGPRVPAYRPSSKEEMVRNLEANWDRIDERIAEKERNPPPPPFGYAIQRLLRFGSASTGKAPEQ